MVLNLFRLIGLTSIHSKLVVLSFFVYKTRFPYRNTLNPHLHSIPLISIQYGRRYEMFVTTWAHLFLMDRYALLSFPASTSLPLNQPRTGYEEEQHLQQSFVAAGIDPLLADRIAGREDIGSDRDAGEEVRGEKVVGGEVEGQEDSAVNNEDHEAEYEADEDEDEDRSLIIDVRNKGIFHSLSLYFFFVFSLSGRQGCRSLLLRYSRRFVLQPA